MNTRGGAMSLHAFVDESFQRNHTMAAALLPAAEVKGARATIRRLPHPGQKRIHFYKESDARRSQILDALETLGLRSRLYVSAEHAKHPRDDCLSRMVPDLAAARVTRLVLERDDSLVEADRKMLYELARKHASSMTYVHLRVREDLLLVVPGRHRLVLDQGRTLEGPSPPIQRGGSGIDSAKPRPPTVRRAAGLTSSG